mgnify:CR=1 FL=1
MGEVQSISLAKEYSELSGINSVPWSDTFRIQFQAQIPFLYETAFMNGQEALKPWENPGQYLPPVLQEWEKLNAELHKKFTVRKLTGVPELMRKAIAFFYELIFWCNQQPVDLSKEQLTKLTIKPINTVERLAFITARPTNYHSYVQLAELFIELQKVFSKEQVMKKASKP